VPPVIDLDLLVYTPKEFAAMKAKGNPLLEQLRLEGQGPLREPKQAPFFVVERMQTGED
jgi:hypothetical protein